MSDILLDVFGELEDFSKAQSKPARKVAEVKAPKPVKEVQRAEPAPAPAESWAPQKIKVGGKVAKHLAEIEARFLEVAGLTGDLGSFPITKENHLQVKTDKAKSNEHGEVFTPLWLVDDMISRIDDKSLESQQLTTRDLCSGYGQFTVRLMRKKYQVLGERFNIRKFLEETHSFIELQPNSCYRLLYIFGTGIRLCMGDATKLGHHSLNGATEGIWVWCDAGEHWVDRTKAVQRMADRQKKGGVTAKADAFEAEFIGLLNKYSARFTNGKEK